MGRRFILRAEVFTSGDDASAKEILPHAIHIGARGSWRVATDHPLGEGQAVDGRTSGQGIEKGRHTRLHFGRWLSVIAASEDVRLAWRLAKLYQQLRIALGIIAPECGDLFVRFVPGRDSCAPISEDGLDLRRGAAVAGNSEYVANCFRQRVGYRIGRIRHREPEPPEIVVVKIAAAVRLI